MKRACDTCETVGRVLTMVPGNTGEPVEALVECPDCGGVGTYETDEPEVDEHDVETCEDDHEERWRRPRLPVRLYRRVRWRVRYVRNLWRDRNATTIAAYIVVNRNIVADEPQLRALLNRDLMDNLEAVAFPLGWRWTDVRWAWANLRRSLRGRAPLPLPYEVLTDVSMRTENGFFERNEVMILAERRRRAIVVETP